MRRDPRLRGLLSVSWHGGTLSLSSPLGGFGSPCPAPGASHRLGSHAVTRALPLQVCLYKARPLEPLIHPTPSALSLEPGWLPPGKQHGLAQPGGT